MSLHDKSILLVESNGTLRGGIHNHLIMAGAHVITQENVLRGMLAAKCHVITGGKIDLIITSDPNWPSLRSAMKKDGIHAPMLLMVVGEGGKPEGVEVIPRPLHFGQYVLVIQRAREMLSDA